MKTNLRKTFNILIRTTIVVLTFVFIYDQVFHRKNYQEIIDYFPIVAGSENFYFLLLIIIFLIPVNLFLEIWKWKYLIDKLEKVTYWNATKAVLTGYSVSMFMPNRVGEYLGRIYVLKNAGRIQAILVTVLGSMAQLLTTLIFGILSLVFIFPEFIAISENINFWLYSGLVILAILFIALSIFAYLNFSFFSEIVKRITGRKLARIQKFTVVFSWYSSKNMFVVLIISLIRYIVFSFQFFLLLQIFLIPIDYLEGVMVISIIYLLMAIIPTIALTELGVRGSVSLYVFGLYFESLQKWTDQTAIGVVSSSTLLWLLNLALPALLGTIFVYSLRFFRNNKNDSN